MLSCLSNLHPTVKEMNQRQNTVDVQALQDEMDRSVRSERFILQLIGGSGITALILAAAGVYCLMMFHVVGRTKEIGIRMSLGASRKSIRQLVFKQTTVIVSIGLALGSPVALGTVRLLQSGLFKVQPWDPMTFARVGLLIVISSMLAALIPAQRAAAIEPMSALRDE